MTTPTIQYDRDKFYKKKLNKIKKNKTANKQIEKNKMTIKFLKNNMTDLMPVAKTLKEHEKDCGLCNPNGDKMTNFINKELEEILKITDKQYIDLIKWLYDNHKSILRAYEKTKGKIRIEFLETK